MLVDLLNVVVGVVNVVTCNHTLLILYMMMTSSMVKKEGSVFLERHKMTLEG